MSVSPSTGPPSTATLTGSRAAVADYVELLKPRLASLVIVTTVVGFYLGWTGSIGLAFLAGLTHTVLGTALVAGAAMVLNQVLERDTDALMHRTRHRPIPSGRVGTAEATVFGVILGASGMIYLSTVINGLTGALAALTIGSYLFCYTPLKSRTPLCTLVGAVPGAIPPMMGFTAAAGLLDARAWILFAILFVWQMPHFLAIAWLYRDDYARGRQLMLTVVDPQGVTTARHITTFSLCLLPVSLMPTVVGMAGMAYFAAAMVLGMIFLTFALRLAAGRTEAAARALFIVSILYLPALLGVMVYDRVPI